MVTLTVGRRNLQETSIEALAEGKVILVADANWNRISNIIAKFRNRGTRIHSHKVANGLFMLWPG